MPNNENEIECNADDLARSTCALLFEKMRMYSSGISLLNKKQLLSYVKELSVEMKQDCKSIKYMKDYKRGIHHCMSIMFSLINYIKQNHICDLLSEEMPAHPNKNINLH